MAITIQLNRELNQTPFNQFWREGDGFSLIYQTPFYRGNITAGMAYTPYHGKTSDRPDYQSYFISLGWFYPFCLPFKFQYAPGIRFGNYLMNFDIDSDENKYESEIGYDIFCFLERPITDQVCFNIELSRTTVSTYEALTFSHIRTGLTFKINETKWLEDLFK